MSQTAPINTTDARLDNGDGEGIVAHYANKVEVARALVDGTPIVALCGKKFVPQRDPEQFPVCQKCDLLKDVRANRQWN